MAEPKVEAEGADGDEGVEAEEVVGVVIIESGVVESRAVLPFGDWEGAGCGD